MECGKVRSNGSPIFYFVVDPITPEKPSANRVRTYYVVTHVDSYVEAFYYLARFLSTPQPSLDEAIARWHALYTRVFGSVSLESFRKSLVSVPVEHFELAPTEEMARDKAEAHRQAPSMRGVDVSRGADRHSQHQNGRNGASAAHVSFDPNTSRMPPGRQSPTRSHYDAASPMRGGADGREPSAIGMATSRLPSRLDADVSNLTAIRAPASTAEGRSLFAEHFSTVEKNRVAATAAGQQRSSTASSLPPPPTVQQTRPAAAAIAADVARAAERSGKPAAQLNTTGFYHGAPPVREDAKVELHRLRAEHGESAFNNIDYSRAKVNALSDAERAALLYQLGEARKDATQEKAIAQEASERLRAMTKSLQDRIDSLVEQHEATLRERSSSEHARFSEMEDEFMEREKAMTREYETAIHDRERKLARAITRVKAFETHYEEALNRIEEQKVKIQELTMKQAESKTEVQQLEEENRRLKRQLPRQCQRGR